MNLFFLSVPQQTSELVEAVESGEEVVAEVNEAGQGEAEVSMGIEIPLMEAGSNLLEEYKEGIGSDETLVASLLSNSGISGSPSVCSTESPGSSDSAAATSAAT